MELLYNFLKNYCSLNTKRMQKKKLSWMKLACKDIKHKSKHYKVTIRGEVLHTLFSIIVEFFNQAKIKNTLQTLEIFFF